MSDIELKTRAAKVRQARASIRAAERYVATRPSADASTTIRDLIGIAKALIFEIERLPATAKETT